MREKVTSNVYAMKVLKKNETLSQDNVCSFYLSLNWIDIFSCNGLSGAVLKWLGMQTHGTGAVVSNPACVTVKNAISEVGNGKAPHNIYLAIQNQSPFLLLLRLGNGKRDAQFIEIGT